MAINIVIADKVGIKVKGQILDATGTAQPYDFKLTCLRLDAEQITARLSSEMTIGEFLSSVVEDWSGPRDAQGQPMPYSPDALMQLCKIPGVAKKAFDIYLRSCGDVEKN